MKIRTKDQSLPLPPWGRIEYVCVDTRYHTNIGVRHPMMQITNAEMDDIRSKAEIGLQGIPLYYSTTVDTLQFFPPSSGNFNIYIRFYGPSQEI